MAVISVVAKRTRVVEGVLTLLRNARFVRTPTSEKAEAKPAFSREARAQAGTEESALATESEGEGETQLLASLQRKPQTARSPQPLSEAPLEARAWQQLFYFKNYLRSGVSTKGERAFSF